MSEPGVVQVTVAGDDREQLLGLARAAVDARLAACAQVSGPITSVYRWQGAVESGEEWLLTLKTAQDRVGPLRELVVQGHGYDVPEVLVGPVVDGLAAYLDWVVQETR